MRKALVAALKFVVADKLPDMPQLDKMMKEELEKAFEEVEEEYDLYKVNTEPVDSERRDGFIPDTQGGYQIRGFTDEGHIVGSGNFPPDDKATKAIKEGYEYSQEAAAEEIWKENEEDLKEAGFKDKKEINYHSLNDNEKLREHTNDLAQEYSEKVDAYTGDDSSEILFGMGVFYYEPDGDSKEHSIYIYSEINWEAPYFRSGKGASVSPFEEDIDFESAGEVRPKLVKALKAAAASLTGGSSRDHRDH